jgi:hypothetical protein
MARPRSPPGRGGREGACVLADQVVQPVPAVCRLGQQVLVIERLQATAGYAEVGAVHGGGVGADIGTGVHLLPPGERGHAAGQRPRCCRCGAGSGSARQPAARDRPELDRAGPVRCSASASSRTVSRRGVAAMPAPGR